MAKTSKELQYQNMYVYEILCQLYLIFTKYLVIARDDGLNVVHLRLPHDS